MGKKFYYSTCALLVTMKKNYYKLCRKSVLRKTMRILQWHHSFVQTQLHFVHYIFGVAWNIQFRSRETLLHIRTYLYVKIMHKFPHKFSQLIFKNNKFLFDQCLSSICVKINIKKKENFLPF